MFLEAGRIKDLPKNAHETSHNLLQERHDGFNKWN